MKWLRLKVRSSHLTLKCWPSNCLTSTKPKPLKRRIDMRLVKPSFKVLGLLHGDGLSPVELIELSGRTCYKSEDKITQGSAIKFAQSILKRGHESVIEHSAMTVRF